MLLLCTSLVSLITATAQSLPSSPLDRVIALDLHAVTLHQALDTIQARGHVELNLVPSEIDDVNTTITLHDPRITVRHAIDAALAGTPLHVVVTQTGGIAIVTESRARADAAPPTATGAIHGRIVDAVTSEPLRYARIGLDGRPAGTTGDNGEFAIPNVSAGPHSLDVRHIGYLVATRSVTVTNGDPATVDIALTPSTNALDRVVVTGTVVPTAIKALPTPISVITDSLISIQRPFTVSEVLRQAVPTAVAFDAPSQPQQTSWSVRGASSLSGLGNMKIFIDGVEASAFDEAPIDPQSIERIEIIRGPEASTIYGANAIDGVVQIFTKSGANAVNRPQVDLQAALGDAQTPYASVRDVLRQEYSGSVRGGGSDASYNFGGGYTHLGNWLPGGEISDQSAPSAYGGMHYSRGIIAADLSARYLDNMDPIVFNPQIYTEGFVPESRPQYLPESNVSQTFGAQISATPTAWWRNQLTFGVDQQASHESQARPRLTTPTDTLLTVQDETFTKVSVAFNTSVSHAFSSGAAGSLIAGVDHYQESEVYTTTVQATDTTGDIQTLPPGAFDYNRTTVTNTGYFTQTQLSAFDAIFFTAGVRAETNSGFSSTYPTAVLPRFGLSLVRDIGNVTVKVRGSYGQALRVPSAGEAGGSVANGSVTIPNHNLLPEEQRGWDAGIDVAFGRRATLSLSGFDQTATNLISEVEVAVTPEPTGQYINIGRVLNRGFEAEGTLTTGWVRWRAQYGYVESRVQAVDTATTGGLILVGDKPLGLPAATGGAGFTFIAPTGTSVNAGLTYVGSYRQFDVLGQYACFAAFTAPPCPQSFVSSGFSNERGFLITYPAFAKINLTVSQQFTPQLAAFVSIKNLTNRNDYEGSNVLPVMGRVTMIGLHLAYR